MEQKTTIAEQIKLAEEKGLQICIIGAGNTDVKTLALIEAMAKSGKVLLVAADDLTEEDKAKINEAKTFKNKAFEPEPTMILKNCHEPMPEISVDDLHKKPFGGFRKKKLKGWQKNKR